MRVATLLNVHANLPVVLDTIDSIQTYMTKDILVIKDGNLKKSFFPVPVPSILGFRHGCNSSPYRNVALGLKVITDHYDADWYCYLEYDCLVGSDRFKKSLEQASDLNIFMLGSSGRVGSMDGTTMPLINNLVNANLTTQMYYLLGCCQFFSKKFIDKLKEINFFNRFLSVTNEFSNGKFPEYTGYDLSEHLYPTLARYFEGNIGVLSTFQDSSEKWHGNYKVFPLRFKPDLNPESENFSDASLLHPLKDFNNPIRQYHREKRKHVV